MTVLSSSSIKVLSWNTLSPSDTWSLGWGCPLEQIRRDDLLISNSSSSSFSNLSAAEQELTSERYERLETTILDDVITQGLDLILVQEVTPEHSWIFPQQLQQQEHRQQDDGDDCDYDQKNQWYELSDDHACNLDSDQVQQIYYRSSTLEFINSSPLMNDGLPGCLAVFSHKQNQNDNNSHSSSSSSSSSDDHHDDDEVNSSDESTEFLFYVANIHAKARTIRDPDLRPSLANDLVLEVETALSVMGFNNASVPGILCGDWNAHLSTIEETFASLSLTTTNNIRSSSSNHHHSYNYTAGMLTNNTNGDIFSTNHEKGFLAQYDGCILATTTRRKAAATVSTDGSSSNGHNSSPSGQLEIVNTTHNTTGFMPKGIQGNLTGLFDFDFDDTGDYDPQQANVYYNGTVISGSNPSIGTSDHLRIVTEFSIVSDASVNHDEENDQ